MNTPYQNWGDVCGAAHSPFYFGTTQDSLFDRAAQAYLSPSSEALFTQSNARVLIGQSANGSLRMLALPTQVYPAPTGNGEFGLGPGMYHHFDVVMYAGDLHYQIVLESARKGEEKEIDLASDERSNKTYYADHYLPLTRAAEPGLEIHLLSIAPVAPDARRAALTPAPLPGPAGCLYLLRLKNTGSETVKGKVILKAGDLLVGHYEDAEPDARLLNRPEVSLRQRTLILSRPFGAIGIHLHEGKWVKTSAPFQAEKSIRLAPGDETIIEADLAIGATYAEVMPTIFALHLSPALAWVNRTTAFWQARLGRLAVHAEGAEEEAQVINETYIRAVLDNFNCLQTDAQGRLIAHWQGAPSHGYGTIWGIDVEPTAVSLVHACPELTLQVMLFFASRSRAPVGLPDHSVPILVAPLILARQWLMATGDVTFFQSNPQVVADLQGIMDELLTLKAPAETLFPSRFSSDGPVGRRYDFGTNAKVFYAFDALAYLLRRLGREDEAAGYAQVAQGIRAAVERHMIVSGPFGPQISGGTNLGEDPQGFYLPENWLYYDGEDTSSMLAGLYGICDLDWEPWINYHRYARSLWCYHYDPEFGVLNWFPREYCVVDGTAFFSRLGGSVTPAEMEEAIAVMRAGGIDDVTGSQFWWPHGVEYKRALTRCSQGQGAWAWQYLQQWLGITVDRAAATLTLAPAGLLTSYHWQGFRSGPTLFDIAWEETPAASRVRVRNHNPRTWTVRVGFRQPGSGATARMVWKELPVAPGEEAVFDYSSSGAVPAREEMTEAAILRNEGEAFSLAGRAPEDRLIFRRYGPALLWGNWDARKLWDLADLPNSLRFVVANLTGEDWDDVQVSLTCPEGWTAQARQPRHWPKPDQLQDGEVCLSLGAVPSLTRTVAPFWVRAPGGKGLLYQPAEPVSSHYPSQPSAGLQLSSPEIMKPIRVVFTARLTARSGSGRQIEAQIEVPVTITPSDNAS